MTDDDVLIALRPVFRDVFGRDVPIELATRAEQIPNWDSMTQVTLAVEVENAFGVTIRSAEMERLRSVRDLVDLIGQRVPATVR